MPGRNVIQWDKEDVSDMGLIKVDLLGLGMMAVLKDCTNLIPQHYGKAVDIATDTSRRPAGVRIAPEGRHHWIVSGRIAGADGLAPAQQS